MSESEMLAAILAEVKGTTSVRFVALATFPLPSLIRTWLAVELSVVFAPQDLALVDPSVFSPQSSCSSVIVPERTIGVTSASGRVMFRVCPAPAPVMVKRPVVAGDLRETAEPVVEALALAFPFAKS